VFADFTYASGSPGELRVWFAHKSQVYSDHNYKTLLQSKEFRDIAGNLARFAFR
jgi:hypothetical protein